MTATTSWITHRTHSDGAEACVRDTNVRIWGLVEWRRVGRDDAAILASIPGLTLQDLAAAWDYYEQHPAEIEEAIRRNEEA
jgi:uncharacterized protein (DUF433 family)